MKQIEDAARLFDIDVDFLDVIYEQDRKIKEIKKKSEEKMKAQLNKLPEKKPLQLKSYV